MILNILKGVATRRIPSDPCRTIHAEQKPQELLRRGGADRLLTSSLSPGYRAQPRQNVTGKIYFSLSNYITIQSTEQNS